jgi:hypothetical protein
MILTARKFNNATKLLETLLTRWRIKINTVACLLKARIVKPAETAVARDGTANTPFARQWLSSRHVIAATDTHVTIEELLEAVFSSQSMPRAAA